MFVWMKVIETIGDWTDRFQATWTAVVAVPAADQCLFYHRKREKEGAHELMSPSAPLATV